MFKWAQNLNTSKRSKLKIEYICKYRMSNDLLSGWGRQQNSVESPTLIELQVLIENNNKREKLIDIQLENTTNIRMIEIQLKITTNTKLKIGNLWPLICCQVERGKKIHLKVSLLYCCKE